MRVTEKWREDIEKGVMPAVIRKTFVPERVDTTDGDIRKAAFVVSTGDEDRDGDVVNPGGWELEDYRKNPVVLWAHDLKSLPIARAETIMVHGGKLKAVTAFPEKGVYPFADTVYGLVKGGFIRGTSVGFHPIEASPRRGREKGVNFTRQSLYEFSLLPIPSNRNALVEAKSAGHDIAGVVKWAEDFLDFAEAEGIWIPKFGIQKALRLVLPLQVSVPAVPLEEVKAAPEGHATAGADSWASDILNVATSVEKKAADYGAERRMVGTPSVKQEGSKWCLYAADGAKLGEYGSKAEAMAAMPETPGVESNKKSAASDTTKEGDMDIIKGIADELFGDQEKGTPPWLKEGSKPEPKPAADAEPDPADAKETAEPAEGAPPAPGQEGAAPAAPAGQDGAEPLTATLLAEIEPLKQGGDPTQIAQALKAALEKFAAAFMTQYANPAMAGLPGQATPPPPPPPAATPPAAPPPPVQEPQKKGFDLGGEIFTEDEIRETIVKAVRQNMDAARMHLTGKLPG